MSRSRSTMIVSVSAGAAMMASAAVAVAPAGAAVAGCSVAYTVSSQWQGGFNADVSITNLGDPLSGWTLTWSYGPGQTATQAWNASVTQSGAAVTAAAGAADALAKLSAAKPDLLVSDIEMADEDGYSLIRKVRAAEEARGRKIPAIALTAHARSSDRLRALAEGYQMHITKPVEPAELVLAIANLTDRLRT